MGDSPKWVKSKKRRKKKKERKRERLNNGDNNGNWPSYAWCTQGAWAKKAGGRDRTLAIKSRRRRKKRERKRERLNNGDNNGQATHGARKHAWRTQAAWANYWLFLCFEAYIKQ